MAQATIDNKIIHDFAKGLTRHWLTPPDVYKKLDDEFHFTFDPCPCPKPRGYNSLEIEWGEVNYVNPPFITTNGIGPTAFAKKAIEESRKGRTCVLTLPTTHYTNLLLEAGAEVRSLGRVRWLEVESGKPMKNPSPISCFILRGRRDETDDND